MAAGAAGQRDHARQRPHLQPRALGRDRALRGQLVHRHRALRVVAAPAPALRRADGAGRLPLVPRRAAGRRRQRAGLHARRAALEPARGRLRPHGAQLSRRAALEPRGTAPGAGRLRAVARSGRCRGCCSPTSSTYHCDGDGCPASAIQVADNETLARVLDGFTTGLAIVLMAIFLTILVAPLRVLRPRPAPRDGARAVVGRHADGRLRRVPGLRVDRRARPAPDLLDALALICFASTPYAFLYGLARSRVVRAGAVAELLLRIGETPDTGPAADAAGRGAGRPLAAARLLAGGQAAVGRRPRAGRRAARRPVTRPAPGRRWSSRASGWARSSTRRDWSRQPDAVRSVAAAAGLAMQNERLAAELRARVEELHTSRSRLIEVALGRAPPARAQPARRRPAAPRRALAHAAPGPGEADQGARVGAEDAARPAPTRSSTWRSAELRELARGIHPGRAVRPRPRGGARGARRPLARAGRWSRCRARACRTRSRRRPTTSSAEALTNIVRYADASEASVSVARRQRARGRRGRRRRRRRSGPGAGFRPAWPGR